MRRRSQFHRSIFRTDPNGDPAINTTPLIDVMLVMLVMFIITLPPPTHSVDVTLPVEGGNGKILDANRVTIDTSDIIRWNGEAVDLYQQRAADGIWYRASGYELRGKGVMATWSAADREPTECRAVD